MVDKKITDLEQANALQGSELFPVVQSAVTRQGNINQILSFIYARISTKLIPEDTNLYYTNARADARVNVHASRVDNPHNVTAAQLGLSNVSNLKNNRTATTDPSSSDDTGLQYSVGSEWINVSTGKVFLCVNNTLGSAVWRDVTNVSVTKNSVGLGNVENTALSTWAGTSNITTVGVTAVTAHVASINHNALLNYSTNQHVDHTAVLMNAGAGISGGGSIAASRTFALDYTNLTTQTTIDYTADIIGFYDASALAHRKATIQQLLGADTSTRLAAPRQTLLNSQVDSNNNANYLVPASNGFDITAVANATDPFRFSLAAGTDSRGTVDYTKEFITNQTLDGNQLNKGIINNLLYERDGGGNYNFDSTPVLPHCDSYFNKTDYALLHFDGANASTNFLDEFGNTWVGSGNAQLSTAQKVFGTASLLLDGTGDWIDSSDIGLLGYRWSFDCWFRTTSIAAEQVIFMLGNTSGYGVRVAINTSGKLKLNTSATGSAHDINGQLGNVTISTNTWYHVQVEYSGQWIKIFVNGIVDMYKPPATRPQSTSASAWKLRIGGDTASTNGFNGYIDEFRFTNNAQRYGVDFTVPAAPYTPDAIWYNTLLGKTLFGGPNGWAQRNFFIFGEADTRNFNALLHCNGSNGSTVITDVYNPVGSGGLPTWMPYGNAQILTAVSKFGGASLYLDGTGDYIESYDPLIMTADKSSWEIDGWFRFDTVNTQHMVLWNIAKSGGMIGAYLFLDQTTSKLYFYAGNVAYNDIANGSVSTTTFAINTFYHISLTFNGTSYIVRVNGTAEITVNSTVQINPSADTIRVGYRGDNNYYYKGYIDELRIRFGWYEHNANFTAPSVAYTDPTEGVNHKMIVSLTPYNFAGARQTTLLSNPVTGKLGVLQSYNHNLGTRNIKPDFYLKCLISEAGYSVGDILTGDTLGQYSNSSCAKTIPNHNTAQWTLGSTFGYVPNKTTGANSSLTAANWQMFGTVQRGF